MCQKCKLSRSILNIREFIIVRANFVTIIIKSIKMNILKKIFTRENTGNSGENVKQNLKRSSWYGEFETNNNNKDNSVMFTNPFELQKHFEQQIKEILKSIEEHEECAKNFEYNFKNEFYEPKFEGEIPELQTDQLNLLLEGLSSEMKQNLSRRKNQQLTKQQKEKLSDEELIKRKIHGTLDDEDITPSIKYKQIIPKVLPHFNEVFEKTFESPKIFRQSIITQTIRKPDGTCETKKVVHDVDGNIKTTSTKTIDGKTESITTYSQEKTHSSQESLTESDNRNDLLTTDCNIFVSEKGYALPKNLW